MKNENVSIVFFGSGPVAAESLRLLAQNFEIEAVVTKATTLSEMQHSAPDSKILTVSNKDDLDQLIKTENFKSNIGVLIDFGIIVSRQTIDSFDKGIVNSHFSLLPELRGADPISFAILEGKTKTGVSLMLLVEEMDEGPIISIGEHVLSGRETTPELTEDLIQLSYSLLAESLPKYLSGEIAPRPQSFIEEEFGRTPSYTRKLTKQDGEIDWKKNATQIDREVRAFSGWPKSRTSISEIELILIETEVINASGDPGKAFIIDKKLGIYCGEGALLLNRVKPANKKEMESQAFLAGYKSRLGL